VSKGALVGLDPWNPLASVVVFQYNPAKLTRSLTGQFTGGRTPGAAAAAAGTPPPPATGIAKGPPLRILGPPSETISAEVVIDASDQLERGDGTTTALGVYPQLSALEMLLYPKSALVFANAVLARTGLITIHNPEAPLTLFVWGLKRVLPVRLTQFSVTEEAYDPTLNPITARVQLGLQVLSYDDLGLLSVGGGIFMAHQLVKEVMATIASVGAVVESTTALFTSGG